VVGDADDRVVYVVESAGLLGFETEIWSLHEQAPVLGANVPAGTQLIRDTAAVNTPQNGLSLYVELGGAGVVERPPKPFVALCWTSLPVINGGKTPVTLTLISCRLSWA
jgi:hypothetical protein